MTNIKDFTVNGSTDWRAYKQAQIAAGEICYQCERYIVFHEKTEQRTLCSTCKTVNESTDSVKHNKFIRCPKCHSVFEPLTFSEFDIYEEGDHDVDCPKCNYFFIVETVVTYSFESPAVMDKEEDLEDEEDIVVDCSEEDEC